MANPKYDLNYVGRVSSAATKAAALADAGPLETAVGHWTAGIMPDVVDTSAAPTLRVNMHALEYVFLPGALFSAPLKKAGMHWSVEASRLAKFMQDLDSSGFDSSPIPGFACNALPVLMRRVRAHMREHFTSAQRLIDDADVVFDGDLSDANTDSWYDFMTPGLLIGNDDDAIMVAHFKLLLPFSYNTTDRASDRFEAGLRGVEAGLRNPAFKEMTHIAQAALVVMFLRSTRPPLALDIYMEVDSISLELARRGFTTADARFAPLARDAKILAGRRRSL